MDFVYICPGEHIYYSCEIHFHHGIFCGDISYNDRLYQDVVIHFGSKHKGGKIRGISYEKFAKGKEIYVEQYQLGSCFDPNIVVQRATSMLNKPGYDLLNNNCEHFARWCKTGKKVSGQVNNATGAVGNAGGVFLAGMALDVFLPLAIPGPAAIVIGLAAGYAAAKVGGEITKGLFTDPTNKGNIPLY